MIRSYIDIIRIYPSVLDSRRGRIVAGSLIMPCALGRGGPTHDKREGDGATPVGCFPLLGAFYRPDRMLHPRTGLRPQPLRPGDGWSDDPRDRRYNRLVPLPCATSHERLWRDDNLYDLVLDIGWNRGPVARGRGSAIFLHLARPDFAPTEGCVAVAPAMIRRLLERIGPRTRIAIMRAA